MLKRLLEAYQIVKYADENLKRTLKQAKKDLLVLRQDMTTFKKAIAYDLMQTVDLERASRLVV